MLGGIWTALSLPDCYRQDVSRMVDVNLEPGPYQG
jgi:hypothetical protein